MAGGRAEEQKNETRSESDRRSCEEEGLLSEEGEAGAQGCCRPLPDPASMGAINPVSFHLTELPSFLKLCMDLLQAPQLKPGAFRPLAVTA